MILKLLNYILPVFVIVLFLCLPSYAHKPSDSYISLYKEGSSIHAKWDIALRDLDYAIGLDDNGDGNLTWGEIKSHHKEISNLALKHFRMKVANEYCSNNLIEQLVDNHSDGAYMVLHFIIDPPGKIKAPKVFDLEYDLFFDFDPQHRGLLNIKHKENTLTGIFSPEKSIQHFNLNSFSPFYQLAEFVREGIWHIWVGFDHILFLLALLLPAVLFRNGNRWEPVSDFKKALWNVFKIVTAFTIAHSVTLTLAVLGIVQLPSRLVESLIAVSVVIAAINNIFPVMKDNRWIAAFFFGLIHGFGFASVLLDIGLPKNTLLLSLFGFNFGVEIGQLVIVSIFMPIAYSLRYSWAYQKPVLIAGSLSITLLASLWFIERAFNLSFMPF